jgi:hypothetical protein
MSFFVTTEEEQTGPSIELQKEKVWTRDETKGSSLTVNFA